MEGTNVYKACCRTPTEWLSSPTGSWCPMAPRVTVISLLLTGWTRCTEKQSGSAQLWRSQFSKSCIKSFFNKSDLYMTQPLSNWMSYFSSSHPSFFIFLLRSHHRIRWDPTKGNYRTSGAIPSLVQFLPCSVFSMPPDLACFLWGRLAFSVS